MWARRSEKKPKQKLVRKKLADGTIRIYSYDRKKPEDSRYIGPAADSIAVLIEDYQRSPEWARLSETRKRVNVIYLRPLSKIGRYKIADLRRAGVISLRNECYEGKPGASNGFVDTVRAMFTWAIQNDKTEYNPAKDIKAIPGGHLPAWSQEQADKAIAELPEHLRRVILLALYTGQRRGDLVRLAWSNYDGERIRLTQGKTRTSLIIPVHPMLKAAMDTWERRATTILVNARGRPWRADSLSAGLRYALDVLGFPVDANIHGVRKLAATNLAEAGCSAHEIASITGHQSLAMVQLYTASVDQERMATAAIVRLQTRKR
jgi:integrase